MTENQNKNTKISECPYGDLYIYYLEGHLSPGFSFDQATFIGNWQEDEFSFLFFKIQSDDAVNALLEQDKGLTLLDQYQMSYEDWQGGPVLPFIVGNFQVHPPWITPERVFNKTDIILDPGVVFGTGTHPTTHACIEFVDKLMRFQKIDTVLDLGTGTGLLSLAAGKLGARKVYALDFNYLAVKTTLLNVRLNGLDEEIFPVQGRAENFMNTPADLLVANIHYDVMKHLIRDNGFLEKKWFILSGLLRSQAKAVEEELSAMPVTILEKTSQDDVWYTFFGKTELP